MLPFLSVVVPAYNEERRILPTLQKLTNHLSYSTYTSEILVIDNGSTDATVPLVRQHFPHVRLESIPTPGKGGAIRHGMLRATGANRFMCDADMAMPVEFIDDFLAQMDYGYDVVLGSRQVQGAKRHGESPRRYAMGRLFNWIVRVALVGDIRDTQCGFKMFRGDVADEVFPLVHTNGWAFDVEVILISRERGLRILEMPISWNHDPDSKVSPLTDSLRMLKDVFKIFCRSVGGAVQLTMWYTIG